ncbi:TetR/AcrR family transcriptional regulator [Mycobacterium koreense]|uniref:TetR family transcriptional regulator n=1 Tax=Mycolicibacillus koreensis TaxID=1069220 RepID=A0A7I7SCR1_9MYCO|nr:TetR/AcrR family transcriptional regulator [Mycolicibacillus koreensis]MCV7249054.1 TetR/AcrR family transcriptional regulator [Mycolicibacillus koreensis]ODR08548.1 AsnC family transcriptional regulator [Mycolicibacillus koreensis]OSC34106.1 TetR family transcriptional regulator [Mycolicibacillus koreensis]BBY54568.1 AsnC family transcriptional regulator [Mycolicibacillus koreensis]
MRRPSRPADAAPPVKVDARRERWREHRKKVRAEIVDAAFRAIDRRGPEISVREIAEEAGTAKPKIYRHFADKADLFQAVSERMRDMLWAAIYPAIDLATDSADEVIRKGVEQYVRLVDEHPNVLRFLLLGRFTEQTAATQRALQEGREIMLAIAELFSNELRELELDPDVVELAAFTTFGSVASATDWWLGSETASPRRMAQQAFVEHLSVILSGTVISTAALVGVVIDPAQPIHAAVVRRAAS